ncbi:putative Metallothionein, family 15, plant [Helianthus debilis subsp. tardiflorus]
MSSSTNNNCCGGSCDCGPACKCQTSSGGCKANPNISNSDTTTTVKSCCQEGSETRTVTSDGCKCGPNCNCNPCTCK